MPRQTQNDILREVLSELASIKAGLYIYHGGKKQVLKEIIKK